MIIRAFGDVEFGAVVIGANLSIGDNDTLAKLIEAMVDQISRRSVEAVFYELFKEKEGDNQNFVELLKLVGDIYGSLEL